MKLQLKEIQFFENISYSLSEEIDIFYCLKQNTAQFETQTYDQPLIKDKLINIIETLENRRDGDQYSKALQQLYIFSMGQYSVKDTLVEQYPNSRLKKVLANNALNQITSIQVICQNLNHKMSLMPSIDLSQDKNEPFPLRLNLEQETRMLLNILINYILVNINDDPHLSRDVIHENNAIEEMCFRSIKFSLEIPVVPIRKFLILFYLFLRLSFGEAPGTILTMLNSLLETREEWKDLKFLKELQNLVEKEEPRFNMKVPSPVEKFYKRHMNSDNPIPQIIVVGILRVLLTTCPNAARNTGGIDLHSEWSSSLQFAFYKKEFFIENGFKSAHYAHSFLISQDSQNDDVRAEAPDFATVEDYKYENDRHRVIVALVISDFFLFLMKHFKNNHVIQFIYISQLVVDANGVLVLLKFLNQDFTKIDFSTVKIDQKYDFIYNEVGQLQLDQILEYSINSLLRLMYKTCKNQGERIKSYLVQYKAALIMKRLINKFEKSEVADIKKNAGKIIKIQIKYMNRNWRKNNMKIVSLVYQYVKLRRLDDWLAWENQALEEELYLSQDEIRHINSDFNYKHYNQFIEKMEEDNLKLAAAQSGIELNEDGSGIDNEEEKQKQSQAEQKRLENNKKYGIISSGLDVAVDETNILHHMWKKAVVDETFYQNYEQWLEEEVWSYYD
ncbi:UNKNOWN [Stylonychia lemnae]|uniref:Far11/STRP C-terminal domain-containing protein n=1 Tax=Stylonychia lemnae TaxID=5949 RepID=A0A078ARQ0_STYLE|nr:UNKNOWN [Stylonychia lemnae]|eukprot:CDW84661.1 UNKNOWN [Stylonychia lemnae]